MSCLKVSLNEAPPMDDPADVIARSSDVTKV